MAQRIVSPCVGLCSTTVGDSVCRGCQRHDGEILDWLSLTDAERAERMQELDALRVAVASRFLHVENEALLESQLTRHRIRFRSDQPALSRAVELLRVGRDRIHDLSRYGLVVIGRDATRAQDPQALYAALGAALYDAGEARRQAQTISTGSGTLIT
ncbi:DUF1289 domain-containing protein [Halomonas sp. V046]|uniref:DUF1289 domain-containing protein n=1 Tax=Halomonas sp. V046 TaxID=3459611 RepID=UPI004043A08A